MIWKIYAFIFAILGALTCFDLSAVSWPWLIDVALSVMATIAVFRFAYGRPTQNLAAWRVGAAAYIGYDLIYNLCLGNFSLESLPLFLIFAPSYFLVGMYASGRYVRNKGAAMPINQHFRVDHELERQLEASDEAMWAELEKAFSEVRPSSNSSSPHCETQNQQDTDDSQSEPADEPVILNIRNSNAAELDGLQLQDGAEAQSNRRQNSRRQSDEL